MPRLEDYFNNTKASFHERSFAADSLVSQIIKNAEWMPSCCSFHRCIVALCFSAMVAPITISDLSFVRQIHLAIMHICDGCLNFPDEVVLYICFYMSLVSEMGFVSFLRPCTILASSGLSFPTSRDIALGMTWIRCYKSSILDDAFLYIYPLALS